MQSGWCQPVRQEFMENECEALPGVAYPRVRDNRSTLNTKTRYDDDDDDVWIVALTGNIRPVEWFVGVFLYSVVCRFDSGQF